jgi:gamma-glutamyl:cysteine ligase YbdK (ATP-grasp superfamily)|nr:MAG TPA: hypothetical protein [Caudoviricetes sp.]
MTIDAQTIITAGSALAALTAIATLIWRLVRWVDHQREQDKRMDRIEADQQRRQDDIEGELTLIVYGLLASLKGLKEQGCNGPVTEAINKIEKHINIKAHQ